MARSNGKVRAGDSFLFQVFQCHYSCEGGVCLLAESCRMAFPSTCDTAVTTVTVSKGRIQLPDRNFTENGFFVFSLLPWSLLLQRHRNRFYFFISTDSTVNTALMRCCEKGSYTTSKK